MILRYLNYKLKLFLQFLNKDSRFRCKTIKSMLDKIKTKNKDFFKIYEYQKELARNKSLISYQDPGAGSRKKKKNNQICSISKMSSSSRKNGELLYKLARIHQPEMIIELGTSLGIGTFYLSQACSNIRIVTLEAVKEIQYLARKQAELLNINNIEYVNGLFDDNLEHYLLELSDLNKLVFIDGNHTFSSTLKYFELCMKHLVEDSVIIIDDIYWSKEMNRFWKMAVNFPGIKYSIDFFYMGCIIKSSKGKGEHLLISR